MSQEFIEHLRKIELLDTLEKELKYLRIPNWIKDDKNNKDCIFCSERNTFYCNLNIDKFCCEKCYIDLKDFMENKNEIFTLQKLCDIFFPNKDLYFLCDSPYKEKAENIIYSCLKSDISIYEDILEVRDFPVYCELPEIGKKFFEVQENVTCSFCSEKGYKTDKYFNYCLSCKTLFKDGEYDRNSNMGEILYNFLKVWIDKNYYEIIEGEEFYNEYGAFHKKCSICKCDMIFKDEIAVNNFEAAHLECAQKIGFSPLSEDNYLDIINFRLFEDNPLV